MPVIDLNAALGLSQKIDERYLEQGGQVVQSLNTVSIKQSTIEKRPGWIAYGGSIASGNLPAWFPGKMASVEALYPDGQFVAASDGEYLSSFVVGAVGSTWQWKDFAPQCVAYRRPVANASTPPLYAPDVAEWNGLRVFVWQSGAAINYAIRTSANKTILTGQVVSSSVPAYMSGLQAQGPRVIILGTYAICIYVRYNGGVGAISYRSINLAAIQSGVTWVSPTDLVSTSNYNVNASWDIVAQDATLNAVLAYSTTVAGGSAGNRIAVQTLSFAGGSLTTVSKWWVPDSYPGVSTMALRWPGGAYTGGQDIGLVWGYNILAGGSNLAQVAVYSAGGSLIRGPARMDDGNTGFWTQSSINVIPGTTKWIAATSLDPQGTFSLGAGRTLWRVFDSHAGIATAIGNGYNLSLRSRIFAVPEANDPVYGCRMYAALTGAWFQQTQYVAELDINTNVAGGFYQPSPRPIATLAPRISGIAGTSPPIPKAFNVTNLDMFASSPTSFVMPCPVVTSADHVSADVELWEATVDFAHPGKTQSALLSGRAYMAGGVPSTWDGSTVAEVGTLYEPNSAFYGASASAGGSGAGLLSGYTYSYIHVYEWRDRQGNRAQGQPSLPVTVSTGGSTGGSNWTATLTIPMDCLTRKGLAWRSALFADAGAYIVTYRTAVQNGAITGGVYYRTVNSVLAGGLLGGSYQNVETSPSLTITDNASDAVIVNNEVIYTTGGALESDAPSSFADVCAHQQRVYGIGDDLQTIWISTTVAPGQLAFFNDGSQLPIVDMGELVALWSMDDKLFFASATGIGYVVGSGPNIVGASNDLSPPVRIPSDVGVIDPRAVCVTHIGTVFAHAFGLGLLDRSLSIHSEFGDPVTDLLAGNTVTGIVEHPSRPEILVFFTSPAGKGGVACYNYRFSSWSSWSISDKLSSGLVLPPQVATTTSAGQVVTANAVGNVWREKNSLDAAAYYDTNVDSTSTWVPMTVQSAWVKPGGLNGFGSVREVMPIFLVQDWCNWQVSFAYDYGRTIVGGSWGQTGDQLGANPDVGGSLGTVTRFSITPTQQRCSTFSWYYSDAPAGGSFGSYQSTTGQGLRIIGLSADVTAVPIPNRLPAGQKG